MKVNDHNIMNINSAQINNRNISSNKQYKIRYKIQFALLIKFDLQSITHHPTGIFLTQSVLRFQSRPIIARVHASTESTI